MCIRDSSHLGNQESLLEKLLVGIGFQSSSTSQAQEDNVEDSELDEQDGQLEASEAEAAGNDGMSLSNILTRLGNNLGLFRNDTGEEASSDGAST